MRNIMFYIRSLDVKPHWDEQGTLHLPPDEWKQVLRSPRKGESGQYIDRAIIPNYPTQQGESR